VNEYEILLMLDPEAPEERHGEIIARARQLVEQGGGNWLSHDAWGRRRLAYEIDHKTDGVYHLLQFDSEPATLDEVSRVLKISDGVMRHLATRRPKGGGRTAPPPPEAPPKAAAEVPATASSAKAEETDKAAAEVPAAVSSTTAEETARQTATADRLPAAAAETDVETGEPEEYAAPTASEHEPEPESSEPEGGA
jgi:small subunit ribosomal protein S6